MLKSAKSDKFVTRRDSKLYFLEGTDGKAEKITRHE